MPKIKYAEKRFTEKKLAIVNQAIAIVNQYRKQGYDLTLRQVYYQFVARDLLPVEWADKATGSVNNQKSYKKLGDIIGDARLAGLLDWSAIVDRTREMDGNAHWESPDAIIAAVARSYAIDKWEDQQFRPEVWVEKDALEGVVGKVCRRLDIPYFSCRGYTSMTAMWENSQRLLETAERGGIPVVLHLGDHDPSGIDMSRDIQDRVRLFMGSEGDKLQFKRLALNMDQVKRYRPPENPAKSTDSRYQSYVDVHGESSWELDALDPTVIDKLIEDAVDQFRDSDAFEAKQSQEEHEKGLLQATSTRWEEVVELVGN